MKSLLLMFKKDHRCIFRANDGSTYSEVKRKQNQGDEGTCEYDKSFSAARA